MDLEELRSFCLALPGTTECVQWGNDLLFKVGDKMYLATSLEPPYGVSIKCDDESFSSLIERAGIIPAPYLARYKWVHLESLDTLPRREFEERIRASYEAVLEKLPKRVKDTIKAG